NTLFSCLTSLHCLLTPSTLLPYPTLFRSPRPGAPGREARQHPGGGGHRQRPSGACVSDGLRADEEVAVADRVRHGRPVRRHPRLDRKSTRLNASHMKISYAVFCLKKKIDR